MVCTFLSAAAADHNDDNEEKEEEEEGLFDLMDFWQKLKRIKLLIPLINNERL